MCDITPPHLLAIFFKHFQKQMCATNEVFQKSLGLLSFVKFPQQSQENLSIFNDIKDIVYNNDIVSYWRALCSIYSRNLREMKAILRRLLR